MYDTATTNVTQFKEIPGANPAVNPSKLNGFQAMAFDSNGSPKRATAQDTSSSYPRETPYVLSSDRIWNDVVPGRESDFENWYQTEHLPERLAVSGFRLGRRWEAIATQPRYFCSYLVDGPDVLSSAAYIHRLNNPTAWTRRIMSDA